MLDSFALTEGQCAFTEQRDGRHFPPLDLMQLRVLAEGLARTVPELAATAAAPIGRSRAADCSGASPCANQAYASPTWTHGGGGARRDKGKRARGSKGEQ